MEKLIFKKENVCNTYELKKEILTKGSLGTIWYLGDFLETHVLNRPDFYLDWLISSDLEYDSTGGNAYNIYRLYDIVLLTHLWNDHENVPDNTKYTLPYAEMVKILKTWKELVADKNSPKYLTIVENNKIFTLITSNEIPEELK